MAIIDLTLQGLSYNTVTQTLTLKVEQAELPPESSYPPEVVAAFANGNAAINPATATATFACPQAQGQPAAIFYSKPDGTGWKITWNGSAWSVPVSSP